MTGQFKHRVLFAVSESKVSSRRGMVYAAPRGTVRQLGCGISNTVRYFRVLHSHAVSSTFAVQTRYNQVIECKCGYLRSVTALWESLSMSLRHPQIHVPNEVAIARADTIADTWAFASILICAICKAMWRSW